MSTEAAEVNGYGLTDEETREARNFAKQYLKGEDPAPIEVEAPPEKAEEEIETAAEVVVEKQPGTAEGEAPAKETEVVEEADPLAGLPEETRVKIQEILAAREKEAKDLQHKESSSRGRLSAFQRQASEERTKRLELEAKLAGLQTKEAPKPLKESATTPRLKELAENDPAYLEALDEFRALQRKEWEEELKARDAKLDGYTKLEEQHRAEEYQREFVEKLDSEFGNWREVVYKVDDKGEIQVNEKKQPIFSDGYAHFITDQPPAVQKAILNVESPDDALWAIRQYEQWGKSKGFIKTEDAAAKAPNPQADAIKNKREQDLKKTSVPKSSSTPLAVNTPFDPGDEKAVERLRRAAREALQRGDPTIFSNAR